MSKFNAARAKTAAIGPIVSGQAPSRPTFQGGAGYARDARSELFLLAVTNLVGEETFYESADDRDSRYVRLIRTVTREDPDWAARFLRWLRNSANLRSASIVGAAEFARTRLADNAAGMSRQVVDSVLQRADEPGELLAYWMGKHGRALPKPVKRGIADAVRRLYDQRSLLKWDSAAHGYRFADVLELTHAEPASDEQSDLFRYAIDRRHGRDSAIPVSLAMIAARAELMTWSADQRLALFSRRSTEEAQAVLLDAGMTWESVAGWLQAPLTSKAWAALVPSMGYMALLRNLRNVDRARLPETVAEQIAARLADREQVARSRQLPLRFLSAYNATANLRWAWPLEQALQHSLNGIPRLDGRTLVLIDTSASMDSTFSRDGTLKRWDAAALFGLALASRCATAEVVSYAGAWLTGRSSRVFPSVEGESVLRAVQRWKADGYFLNGGTDTAAAVRKHFAGHDRMVILTDEQHNDGDVGQALPDTVPLYTWNLAGYPQAHAADRANRYTFGGLTDQGFAMIRLLESSRNANWPF